MANRPIAPFRRLQKHTRSQGPFLRRGCPASTVVATWQYSRTVRCHRTGVEATDLQPPRFYPITRITLPACRVRYPDDRTGGMCRLLPCPRGLPQTRDGSTSASHLSRPAQTSFALSPAGSLNRPRRPLSRGSDPTSYPVRSLVSYQIDRQLYGWNLPPLMIQTFGARPHFQRRSRAGHSKSSIENQAVSRLRSLTIMCRRTALRTWDRDASKRLTFCASRRSAQVGAGASKPAGFAVKAAPIRTRR